MCQLYRLIFIIFMSWISSFCSWSFAASAGTGVYLEKVAQQRGIVIFLRHALAPGFGDPKNFVIDDCSTQRNLNETGRRQSLDLGQTFRRVGLKNLKVLSSPWCRCLETAKLINVGNVESFLGLGSFFEGHVSRSDTINKLNHYLESIAKTDRPTLMVTHQIVISTITGFSPSSGEAILYNPSNQIARRIKVP